MPGMYIKNAKNKMKKKIRAQKKNLTSDTSKVKKVVPTHDEAVAAAVKEAHKHLKGYI
tara:strand:+ start:1192 stop:1365 length:174 start_codon:yes stop_codon:yes gene_type:complete